MNKKNANTFSMSNLENVSVTNDQKNNDKNLIGNYIIERTIGEGTFGKVKLGTHIPTNERVAIKILEKSKITDKDDSERVQREINFLKKLCHINIIKIYEIIENSKNFFLIMEYASGGELFNYIVKHKRLDEKDASFFFAQIINGLEYIHKNNIVHRDFKPENLLLNEKRIIKIIDFGLSNTYKIGQLLSTPCGSPCYAAPEMIIGKKYSGLMVDIWSTGIVLYAMVCGYLPFEDKNDDSLYKKIILCDLKFPDKPSITENMKDIITKILCVKSKQRIKLEEIKKHPFYILGAQQLKNISFYKTQGDKPKYDNNIISKMVEMGLNKNSIIKNLDLKKTNNETATYYLLFNRFARNDELEEDVKKSVSIHRDSGSNIDLLNGVDINKNNINININYLNKIGNINININEGEAKSPLMKNSGQRNHKSNENNEKKPKLIKHTINQNKFNQTFNNTNFPNKLTRKKGKNISIECNNNLLKNTIFQQNLATKDQVCLTTPRPLNSNNMLKCSIDNIEDQISKGDSHINTSGRACVTDFFNSNDLDVSINDDKERLEKPKKRRMDIILEETELAKETIYTPRENKTANKSILTKTPIKNETPFNYYANSSSKKDNKILRTKFIMRNSNNSINFYTEKFNKTNIEEVKVSPTIRKISERTTLNAKNKKNTSHKNAISSSYTVTKPINTTNSNLKSGLNKKIAERSKIDKMERKGSSEKNQNLSNINIRNRTLSKHRDKTSVDNDLKNNIHNFHTPKNLYSREKSQITQQKNNLNNIQDKNNSQSSSARNKVCYFKLNHKNQSNISKNEEKDSKNTIYKRNDSRTESNLSCLNLPPKEEIRDSNNNCPSDFSCCTINDLEGFLKKLKEFSIRKQMKFFDLGSYKYELSNENGNKKILIEFTSIELSNKSTYLMKIYVFSNDSKTDNELVRDVVSMGI